MNLVRRLDEGTTCVIDVQGQPSLGTGTPRMLWANQTDRADSAEHRVGPKVLRPRSQTIETAD
jgi:hypothetical protein